MSLHLPSLFLLSAMLGLLGTVLLARGGTPDSDADRGAAWLPLLMASLIQCIASLGHSLRGELPPSIVFSFVNATQILAIALLWVGTRRMVGVRLPLWVGVLPFVFWLAACLLPSFMETLRIRIGVYAPLVLGLLSAGIHDLVRAHARDGLKTARDLAIVMVLVGLSLGGLFMEALLFPRPQGTGWGIVGQGAAVISAGFGAALPFLILAIHRERERGALDARRAATLAVGRAQVERLHGGLPAVIFLRDVRPDGSSRLGYQGGDVERVTGWASDDLVDADHPLTMSAPLGWTLEEHLRTTLRHGMAREERLLRQPDGSHRHIRIETRVLGPAQGDAVEVVGYALDVTQEHLANARAMSAMRLASLGEMGAGLAHEVKQPLQALSLAAELTLMVLGPEAPPAARSKLETVLREAERAADIIEHLRRFARGAPLTAPLTPFPLDKPLADALRLTHSALEEAGVEVQLALGSPAPLVMGISTLLEQVLVSLLLNARDALAEQPPGEPRLVCITAETLAGGSVALTVADTGGGIAPEVLPRLFEPFTTTKGPDRGRGLALAAAHGLVRSLGGTLTGGNRGQGAAFTLTLPAPGMALNEATPAAMGQP